MIRHVFLLPNVWEKIANDVNKVGAKKFTNVLRRELLTLGEIIFIQNYSFYVNLDALQFTVIWAYDDTHFEGNRRIGTSLMLGKNQLLG